MTSTQTPQITLIGAAAPKAGDLVTTTNPAGEILVGFILQVIVGGSRLRPVTRYLVRVGSNGGKHLTWDAADCSWTTEERATKAIAVGDRVHAYLNGDWRAATVTKVARTRITLTRTLRNGNERTHMLPAWQLLRVEDVR